MSRPGEERRKIESPLDKKPDVAKTSNAKKFLGGFVASDVADVKEYIIFEVVLPRIKTMLLDAISRGAEMMIMGTKNPRGRSTTSYSREGYTKYYYGDNNNKQQTKPQSMLYAPFNDPLFDDEADAWKVIDEMTDYVEEYATISISEFLTFCKRPEDDEYTFQYYGWTKPAINAARPEQINDGRWIIRLPKPKYIK